MNPKVLHLGLLIAALVGGYFLGRGLRRFTAGRQKIGAAIGLLGAAVFIFALVLADKNRAFMFLGEAALCLQIAGGVSTLGGPPGQGRSSKSL